jgi:hypothetical protein
MFASSMLARARPHLFQPPLHYSPLSPAQWPSGALDSWLAIMHSNDGLMFNQDIVPQDIIMKSFNTLPMAPK